MNLSLFNPATVAVDARHDMRGKLTIESTIDLEHDRRQIRVHTYKGQTGIVCYSTVVQVAADGRSHSYVLFQDFNKCLVKDPARATEKALRQAHSTGLQCLKDHLRAIAIQYSLPYAEADVGAPVEAARIADLFATDAEVVAA